LRQDILRALVCGQVFWNASWD